MLGEHPDAKAGELRDCVHEHATAGSFPLLPLRIVHQGVETRPELPIPQIWQIDRSQHAVDTDYRALAGRQMDIRGVPCRRKPQQFVDKLSRITYWRIARHPNLRYESEVCTATSGKNGSSTTQSLFGDRRREEAQAIASIRRPALGVKPQQATIFALTPGINCSIIDGLSHSRPAYIRGGNKQNVPQTGSP
jgi:hypothetical protein